MDQRLIRLALPLIISEIKEESILRKMLPKLVENEEFFTALKENDIKGLVYVFALIYLQLQQ